MRLLVVLLLASFFVASSSCSASSASSASASACNKAVFLLAGQSNMVGRGGTHNHTWDQNTPPQCQTDPRILRLNNETLWEEAHEPLHLNISFENCLTNDNPFGIGPGMPFANTLLMNDLGIGTIGLVPCAVGGTEISQWSRGSCLYNRLLVRARASLRDGGALRGMLWYQGENDARDPNKADMYEDRLRTFFNDVRHELMLPSLPIIQVALASPNGTSADKIRSVQLNLKLPNVTCVDAKGLMLNDDNLHLTTDSQVKLGSMLADAFLKYFN